jgi:hypothetical protein
MRDSMNTKQDASSKRDELLLNGKRVLLESEIWEQDEDVTKLAHMLIDAETKEVVCYIDWSSYSEPTLEDVKLFIELGCPKRIGSAPLDKYDLIQIKKTAEMKKKLVDRIRETQDNDII